MKIRNTTDLDPELLKLIVEFALPPNTNRRFDITFKNSRYAFRGTAYSKGCALHCNSLPLITIGIGSADKFPYFSNGGKGNGYLSYWVYSRTEALVAVVAHELRHLWQAQNPRYARVWGARGLMSERDADAYALKMLRAWRKAEIGKDNRNG